MMNRDENRVGVVDTDGGDGGGNTEPGERHRVGISVTDRSGTITCANRGFADLFGDTVDRLVGTDIHQLLDVCGESETTHELFERLRAGESVSRDLRLDRAVEEGRTVRWEAIPFGQPGSRSVVGVYVDHTECDRTAAKSRLLREISRRLGEAETYRSGLETTVAAICTYTDWSYGEVWTPASDGDYLEYTLGYTDDPTIEGFLTASRSVTFASGEGLPGRVYDARSPEWIPDASEESVDVFHRAELATEADLRAAFAVPIVADERVVSVLTFFLRERRESDGRLAADITDVAARLGGLVERKQAEQRRRERNEQLDRFTSTVSHDLRNPLSVAQGYLEIARNESSSEALRTVSNSLDRMEELIDNLLTLSRAGDTIGDQTWLSLDEIASAAWDNVRTETASIEIEACRLRGDPTRLQQLFENLFRNAIQHGGADVTVRLGALEPIGTTTRTDTDGLATGFYVEDDGSGIPVDERGSVFDEAYSTGGNGLGLLTVEEIATAHGWTVTCTESRGGGARFEFEETDTSGPHEAVQWSHIDAEAGEDIG